VWTLADVALIKAAAEDPRVNRIFVNPAIKKALCRDAGGDRAWLGKVQPWLGHDWHFHIRLNRPVDSPQCEPQPPRSVGDGCTGSEMHRFSSDALPDAVPPRAGPKLAELPAACRAVLDAPEGIPAAVYTKRPNLGATIGTRSGRDMLNLSLSDHDPKHQNR
jgi:penicillin-insensitive murein endopeptidase